MFLGPEEFECPPNRFRCDGTHVCLRFDQLCDGVPHCIDKTDEGPFCSKLKNKGLFKSVITAPDCRR